MATLLRSFGETGSETAKLSLVDVLQGTLDLGVPHPPSIVGLIRQYSLADPRARSTRRRCGTGSIQALGSPALPSVMSALLEGEPYVPCDESAVYQTYDDAGRDAINAKVNERVWEMTGVERSHKLDPGDRVDRPLVRYWLRLRDEAVRATSSGARRRCGEKRRSSSARRFSMP